MVAAASMVLLFPLMAVLAVLVRLDSRGPVFYSHPRIGAGGHRFSMYKFRTMVADADELLAHLQDRNEAAAGNGQIFKIKNDPRVTRLGRFLRRWSLDELPQLYNVWRGDMSLVGPRPALPREVERYEAGHHGRLRGLPGITGLSQVSGRSDLSFEETVRLDTYYLDNWSQRLDLLILLKTVLVVLTGRGAY